MVSHPLVVVRVDIAPGVEAEWNTWYDQTHLPDVLKVPGFLSGRRYSAVEGTPKYMTLYEILSSEAFYSKEFNQIRGWAQFAPYIGNRTLNVYEPLSSYRGESLREMP